MSTTLEILAPYLPYGIEVEYHGGGTRHLLNGLNFDGNQTWFAATKSFNGWVEFGLPNLLPVLRSFADLCTPLADGTVPAREVGRIVLENKQPFGRTIDFPSNGVFMQSGSARVNAFLVDRDSNNVGAVQLLIDHNYDIEIEDHSGALRHGNLIAAYDYLRRNHFAVGLTADQYIPKV